MVDWCHHKIRPPAIPNAYPTVTARGRRRARCQDDSTVVVAVLLLVTAKRNRTDDPVTILMKQP